MPVLTSFYGIEIRMYFIGAEHNPPHIHAFYGSYVAAVDIRTGEILEGALPNRANKLVREWVQLHSEELYNIWTTQEFKKLSPLE